MSHILMTKISPKVFLTYSSRANLPFAFYAYGKKIVEKENELIWCFLMLNIAI